MDEEPEVYMRELLCVLKMDVVMDVYDFDDHSVWSGPVRKFPWAMTDVEVVQVDAIGKDTFKIVTDTKESEWK